MNESHNHSVNTSGSMKFLWITPEVEQVFNLYFEDGMGAAEAIRLHESKILLNENCWETLANGSKNPNKETVAYLHKKWRKNNFGCVNNPLEKLKEKTQSYAEKGI
ncbi:unnamed protein product [Macrosiphum euphorbiae]|uniref:Uncharacterized protein n=1 Tax=Macrosiphum euphorbiae TaxID=13131 RepID=A0AAV0Y1Y7_9HEMI|nr:unnamed protein product [Macrosiphum euphorbiae]